jgi:hypothetical protein
MKRFLLPALVIIMMLPLSGCIGGGEDIVWDIEVYGSVTSPAVFSYGDLADMEQASIDKQLVNGYETYNGTSLAAIRESVSPDQSVDWINFIADDGYVLSFPLSDVEDGILALDKEGAKLTEEEGGPVMLALNVGCVCNWMKRVQKIEYFVRDEAFGIQGDVTNPMYLTIIDIRSILGQEQDFVLEDLFRKAAYYQQAQEFSLVHDGGEAIFPIAQMADVVISYDGTFSALLGGATYENVTEARCIWTP